MAFISHSPAQRSAHGIVYLDLSSPPSNDEKRMEDIARIYSYNNRRDAFQEVLETFSSRAQHEKIFDLNKAAQIARNAEAQYIGQLQQALIDLSKATINLKRTKQGNGGYSKDIASLRTNHPQQFQEMHDSLKSAITAIMHLKGLNVPANSVISQESWRNALSRFYQKSNSKKLYKFASNLIFNPTQMTDSQYSQLISEFGLNDKKGGQFGQLFGAIIEESLPNLVLNDEYVQNQLADSLGVLVKGAAQFDGGASGATLGTIRTSLNGKVQQSQIKHAMKQGAKQAGNPLRDATVQITPTPGGARIQVETLSDNTTGISIKWRKLTSSHSDITLADIGMKNFFPSIIAERASYGMYILRELARQGNNAKNGIMNWLLAHDLDAITRGAMTNSTTATADLTDLMIINGKLMSVRKAMSLGEPKITISGLPKGNGDWEPGDKAASFISQIHEARVKAYLSVSRTGRNTLMN